MYSPPIVKEFSSTFSPAGRGHLFAQTSVRTQTSKERVTEPAFSLSPSSVHSQPSLHVSVFSWGRNSSTLVSVEQSIFPKIVSGGDEKYKSVASLPHTVGMAPTYESVASPFPLSVGVSSLREGKEVPPVKVNILDENHLFGTCLPMVGGMYGTMARSSCICCQVYLGESNRYFRAKVPNEDILNTALHCEATGRRIFVHCSLIANLASGDEGIARNSMLSVKNDLSTMKTIPSSCVLHIGKSTRGGHVGNVSKRIDEISADGFLSSRASERPLLLETAAGQGSELGSTWEEIWKIFEGLDSKRVGLCIDTQHVFASGLCDFSTSESVVRLFDAAEECIGVPPSLIHLNDSETHFSSKVDRHAPLRRGYIWYRSVGVAESLGYLVSHCFGEGIPMIAETKDCAGDMSIFSDLAWEQ